MFYKKFIQIAPLLAMAIWACDGTEDDDNHNDADVQTDADAHDDAINNDDDAPVQYGIINIYSLPAGKTDGAEVYIDGETQPRCATPCENLQLPVGSHDILLSLSGWIQYPKPQTANITTEGGDVNIQFYRDLTGTWRRESDGTVVDVVMFTPRRLRDYQCPDTLVGAGPFQALGELCVEADETLSLSLSLQNPCQRMWRHLGRHGSNPR